MQSTIWTTQLVEETIDKLRIGLSVNMDCFFERDPELKAGKILFKLTKEELEEFNKCSEDIIYFTETYVNFLTDKGRKKVKLYPHQKKYLNNLAEKNWIEKLEDYGPQNRNLINCWSRQTFKTTSTAAFFSWYMCFHTDRNLAILANKEKTTIEIVSKVIDIFRGLPFFLKPGINAIGKTGMHLDNDCKLFSQATTKTAQIGFTIHVLFADEFAHIPVNIVDDFWRSVYPTLSSSLISQCVICSTPNGTQNKFYDIWDKANKGENTFLPQIVHYYEIPEHDEAWVANIKSNFGEEEFAQEFELQFNISSKLLMGAKSLSLMSKLKKEYIFQDLCRTKLEEDFYRNLKWHPQFDPNKYFDNTNKFVISIDTGEGKDIEEKKNNDYNIINIFQLKLKSLVALKKLRKDQYQIQNMIKMEQVGLYRDNILDEISTGKIAKTIIFDQLNADNCKLFIEMNFNGKIVLNEIMNHNDYYEGIVLHTYHTKPIPGEKAPRKKPGFKVRIDKEYFCKLGKKYIDEKTIIINNNIACEEFSNFGKNKKGTYSGLSGSHDDAVMSTLNISRGYEEQEFIQYLYDFLEDQPDNEQKRLINFYLEQYEDVNTEISDDMFNALFTDKNSINAPVDELSWLNEQIAQHQQNPFKYNPSSTMKFKN